MSSIIENEILRLSVSKNINNAVQEWEISGYKENEGKTGNCFCGRKIKYEFSFSNSITKDSITLGSGCQNFFSNQVKVFKDNQKKQNVVTKIKKPIVECLICYGCHKVAIPYSLNTNYCKNCKNPDAEYQDFLEEEKLFKLQFGNIYEEINY